MPFQPVNYANIEPQGNPFMRDLVDSLTKGYQAGRLPYETGQLEEKQNLDNKRQNLANAMSQMLNQEQPTKFSSDMATALASRGLTGAETNKMNIMTPLEAQQTALANKFYPQFTQAQIDSMKAMANMRNMGGSGLGTGGKEEIMFQNLVKKDNPNLTPAQAYEASNVLRQGGNTLSDGTQLNPMSPASRSSFDRLTKYGSTSPLITGNVRGQQAESEISSLSKSAVEALKPYGDTYLGYSPQQLMDTFKSDDNSQKRLGKFIAGKQLQYEIAQNEMKLANGQPGVTSTQELMELGMQNINAAYPKLSQKAREQAQNYFIDSLKKAFQTRLNVGLGASGSYNQNPESSKAGSSGKSTSNDPLGLR